MSAIIIPFPTNLPSRAVIDDGIDFARRNSIPGTSLERCAYLAGFLSGMFHVEQPPPEKKRR